MAQTEAPAQTRKIEARVAGPETVLVVGDKRVPLVAVGGDGSYVDLMFYNRNRELDSVRVKPTMMLEVEA